MTGKRYHVVGIGISINGSGVAGAATGIGLYTTTKTIFEAVERSDISMILVPNHGRQGIGSLVSRQPWIQPNNRTIQTIMGG